MKTLTVFTPTFNRAFCLPVLYQSLCEQTNKDFMWLIIDDGSSDNTINLVEGWIGENKIQIQYQNQKNQGMHGAHNTAYSLIETELNVCIDSDDFMPENAVEIILDLWPEIKGNNEYAGLVGLDANKNKEIIGTEIPPKISKTTLYDLYHKYRVKGDKKLVYKTDIIKQYPKYPVFEEERFVPLGYLYQLIDQDYKLLPVNEILCIVEYMEDGSSLNMLKQYRRHPKGFAFSRKSRMMLGKSFIEKLKNAIHYVSSSIFLSNKSFISESPSKLITIMAIPMGILLNLYIRIKTNKDFK